MIAVQKRTHFLDLLRILCSFMAVVNHSISAVFLWRMPEDPVWWEAVIIFFGSKFAVPVFFMISGYLMLNKQDTWKKALSRAARIAVALAGIGAFYALLHGIQNYPNTSKLIVIQEALTIYQEPPFQGLWFLYAYMGVQLMLPFLQKLAAVMEKKDFHAFFLVSGFFVGVLPILQHYWPFLNLYFEFRLPLYGGYLCMFFLGGYFARYPLEKNAKTLAACWAIVIFCNAFNVVGTYFEFYRTEGQGYLFFDDRTFLPIVAYSAALFCLASWMKLDGKFGAAISYIGSCTFGVYLLSDIMLRVFGGAAPFLGQFLHPILATFGYQLVSYLGSLAVAMVLKKIPLVKRVL